MLSTVQPAMFCVQNKMNLILYLEFLRSLFACFFLGKDLKSSLFKDIVRVFLAIKSQMFIKEV